MTVPSGRGNIFLYIRFFKGGQGLGCRLGRRWTVATGDHRPPLYPSTGERSHLPVRSALGKRHWRLTPPPRPLLRGGAPVSAPALVGPKRCPLGTRTPLAPPASGGKQELSCRLGDFAGLGVTHPLPPPVRGMGGGEWLVCTGGGKLFYISHFKGAAPLCIPHGGGK